MRNSDTVYKEILQRALIDVEKQLDNLQRQSTNHKIFTDRLDNNIAALTIEKEALEKEIADYEERESRLVEGIMDGLDNSSDKKKTSIEKVSAEIDELRKAQGNLKTKRAIAKVQRKIENKEQKIKRLQKSDNFISGVQRTIMLPKYHLNRFRDRLIYKREAKIEVAQKNIEDINELQKMLNPNESIIDAVQSFMLEIRREHYIRKQERAEKHLKALKSLLRPAKVEGLNVINMKKQNVNKLRARMRKQPPRQEPEYEEGVAALRMAA